MKRPKVIFVVWTAFLLLAMLILCYRYNVQEDIGVNHGIMSLWFILFDSPVYLVAFIMSSILLWLMIRERFSRILLAAIVQVLLALLIVDLHRWRYPSSVSEETLSVFWSTF